MTATATWAPPKPWKVPREWNDERCFILCSGESIGPQAETIKKLKGRFIAVKHGVLLRPDADVLFLACDGPYTLWTPLIDMFRGKHIIARSRIYPEFERYGVKRITRSKDHTELCSLSDHVSGLDSGTSAINLAYHFGAREIVMLGYDMTGGHFCPHPMQRPPTEHFVRHVQPLDELAKDCKRKGVRVVNCSPISKVRAFERRPLESYL